MWNKVVGEHLIPKDWRTCTATQLYCALLHRSVILPSHHGLLDRWRSYPLMSLQQWHLNARVLNTAFFPPFRSSNTLEPFLVVKHFLLLKKHIRSLLSWLLWVLLPSSSVLHSVPDASEANSPWLSFPSQPTSSCSPAPHRFAFIHSLMPLPPAYLILGTLTPLPITTSVGASDLPAWSFLLCYFRSVCQLLAIQTNCPIHPSHGGPSAYSRFVTVLPWYWPVPHWMWKGERWNYELFSTLHRKWALSYLSSCRSLFYKQRFLKGVIKEDRNRRRITSLLVVGTFANNKFIRAIHVHRGPWRRVNLPLLPN